MAHTHLQSPQKIISFSFSAFSSFSTGQLKGATYTCHSAQDPVTLQTQPCLHSFHPGNISLPPFLTQNFSSSKTTVTTIPNFKESFGDIGPIVCNKTPALTRAFNYVHTNNASERVSFSVPLNAFKFGAREDS